MSDQALELWLQKREYNKAYHQRRYSQDSDYRKRKQDLANKQRLDPDYNLKRRIRNRQKALADPNRAAKDAERARLWALSHRERAEITRLRSKYRLTPADVQLMLARQNGCCAICERQFSEKKPHKIDHCHSSNVVRGLLCNSCNTALGKFSDNPETLRRAASYIERSR